MSTEGEIAPVLFQSDCSFMSCDKPSFPPSLSPFRRPGTPRWAGSSLTCAWPRSWLTASTRSGGRGRGKGRVRRRRGGRRGGGEGGSVWRAMDRFGWGEGRSCRNATPIINRPSCSHVLILDSLPCPSLFPSFPPPLPHSLRRRRASPPEGDGQAPRSGEESEGGALRQHEHPCAHRR